MARINRPVFASRSLQSEALDPTPSLRMLSALATLLSIPLLAAATGVPVANYNGPIFGNLARCPTAYSALTFPYGQTALAVPEGEVPNYITLGVGVQNYTCTDAGTYKYAPRLQRKLLSLMLVQINRRCGQAIRHLMLIRYPRF
jgi:hypothetical protein